MKNQSKYPKKLILSIITFTVFLVFTVLVKFVDIKPIGPKFSMVGFATINRAVNKFFGYNPFWYELTQVFGIFAILVAAFFAVLGFIQLIKRKSLLKVDRDILCLGVLYIAVIGFYILFEKTVINCRPVYDAAKGLEPSYPSTHTFLIITILASAIKVLPTYIKNNKLRIGTSIFLAVIIVLTVAGRLVCGVHWFTDIIGGILLAESLLLIFSYAKDTN